MKFALFSDIHGNHVALKAVLADLEKQQPDMLICLGDVATIGPQPKEVLTTLQSLDCLFVQGNHDIAVLQPQDADALNIHPTLLPNLEWTIQQLDPQDLAFLESFQATYEIELAAGKKMLCFHGSPQSTIDLILATTPTEKLDGLLTDDSALVMAGGHTHIQMLRKHHGRLLVNPGSVGNSFVEPAANNIPTLSPWVEYALVEVQNGAVAVHFRRLPLDVAALHASIRASHLPNGAWWLTQYQSSA